MPNQQSQQDQITLFKNWVRERFIAEWDFEELPPLEAMAWSVALREMSQSINHQIVPFTRGRRGTDGTHTA
jgi:hypothetical protein